MSLVLPHIGPLPYGEGYKEGVDSWLNARRRLVAQSGNQTTPSGGGGASDDTGTVILPKYIGVSTSDHVIETENDRKIIWKESNDLNSAYTLIGGGANGISLSKDTGIFTFEFGGLYYVQATMNAEFTAGSGVGMTKLLGFKNDTEFVRVETLLFSNSSLQTASFGTLEPFSAGDEMTTAFNSDNIDARLGGWQTVSIVLVSGVFA